ncbi:MAG: dihydrolipoyl dehydrogenase [bacterium]|nr:dihydrolipoyl dehydrogenase [bacterium]
MKSFDLIVIGSGPGGYVAAIRGSQLGMSVGLVEEDALGGVCLNWGCIPTKAILSAAEQYAAVKKGVPGLIVDGLRADYGAVIDASRKVAGRLSKGVGSLMKKNKIEVVKGRGSLAGSGQVVVRNGDSEEILTGKNIILATGSTEWVFPGVEVDGQRVLTSREALETRELPESMVVIGGGAVGLEFAYSYGSYGTEITLIEMQDQVLPGMDRETADALAQSFTRRGAKLMLGTAYKGLEVNGSGVVVTAEGEKGEIEIQADRVLFAVGRRALTAGIGLEEAGVTLEKGFVKVGPDFRTSADGVWAIGDCNGPPLLAHAASHEGIAAVEFMAGERKAGIDPLRIPACIYSQPQVASVGMNEEQARAAGHDVRVGKVPFLASGKAVGTGHTEGFAKIVSDAQYGELLGCQIIGHGATEMINEFTAAMTAEATIHELAETSHAHPTLSEILMEAALAADGRAINF